MPTPGARRGAVGVLAIVVTVLVGAGVIVLDDARRGPALYAVHVALDAPSAALDRVEETLTLLVDGGGLGVVGQPMAMTRARHPRTRRATWTSRSRSTGRSSSPPTSSSLTTTESWSPTPRTGKRCSTRRSSSSSGRRSSPGDWPPERRRLRFSASDAWFRRSRRSEKVLSHRGGEPLRDNLPARGDGVHSGVQSEHNREQLRRTDIALRRRITSYVAVLVGLGAGRSQVQILSPHQRRKPCSGRAFVVSALLDQHGPGYATVVMRAFSACRESRRVCWTTIGWSLRITQQ